jgi:hypothetical protein
MVELETKEEYEAILKIFEDKKESLGSYHYLGAQSNELGEWKWISGKKFSYEMNLDAFDSDEDEGYCIQYFRDSSKYYSYKCTDTVPQVICEIDGKLVSSTENPTTKYTEPEEVTEFNEPEPVGTEYSGISNKISLLAQNITQNIVNEQKYSYPASVYLIILAGVFILVALWQMIYCCCC